MIYKFAILFSIIFIVFVMHLVRKNKLEEKYNMISSIMYCKCSNFNSITFSKSNNNYS